ncbi:alpha/beta hydrolase [Facilibium subflavum]|uniref:alpha/beta hydrolase n=1 Tax=Facilibium subflavum TaxID=2219058 RepID=UPI000E64CD1D|nr:alpha/beta fold hydrolase [Facilibium subflavum]
MQDSVIIEPKSQAKSCVIWLHGLGADGHDFEAVVPQLNLSDCHGVRFIFPHAPIQPVTINMGIQMRAWYDIKRMDDIKRDVDTQGIEDSVRRIDQIVQAQIAKGIDSKNIILAGFSQGGAVAAISALTLPYTFAGVILLSTYLPDWDYFITKKTNANKYTDFVIAHGQFDHVVPIKAGLLLKETLAQEGFKVQWHQYPMEHSVCMEEIQMISDFIQQHQVAPNQ